MKTLKKTDLWLQALITFILLSIAIIENDFGYIFYLYFILGGLQVLSFLAHLFISAFWVNRNARTSYGQTLLWLVIIGLILYILLFAEIPLLIFFLLGMLVVSPAMAIWYFTIELQELKTIRHHELVHLK